MVYLPISMVNLVVNIPFVPWTNKGYEIIQPFAPTRRPFYNHWIPIKVMSSEGDALEITVKTFMQSLQKSWKMDPSKLEVCNWEGTLFAILPPRYIFYNPRIHQKFNGTESQRTPFSCVFGVFDTQVFFGLRETWVVVEFSWKKDGNNILKRIFGDVTIEVWGKTGKNTKKNRYI